MPPTGDPTEQARQVLALLPILRQWVTTRVQQASADCDLSLRQYAALHSIREGASSPGELARLWQVTPATLTGIVDRLERRGLVQRAPDPSDRRRLRLALTEEGLRTSRQVESALTTDLATQFATASPAELAELGRGLDFLQHTLAALQESMPSPGRSCDTERGIEVEDRSGNNRNGNPGRVVDTETQAPEHDEPETHGAP